MECRQLLSFCQACLSAGGDVREVGALGGWEKKIGASPAWISRGDPGGVCLGIDAAATPDRAQISVGGIAGAIRGSADRVLERAVGQMAYGLTVQSKSLRSLLAHLGVSFRLHLMDSISPPTRRIVVSMEYCGSEPEVLPSHGSRGNSSPVLPYSGTTLAAVRKELCHAVSSP